MDFIIDTLGDTDLQEKETLINTESEPFILGSDSKLLEFLHKKKEELDAQAVAEKELQRKLSQLKVDAQFDEFFAEMHWNNSLMMNKKRKPLFRFNQLDKDSGKLKSKLSTLDIDKELKKSVLQPGIEKEHNLPEYNVSDRRLKNLRKIEREKTKGPQWFDMKAPEMTKELKDDLQVLKMRSVLNPKRFYKKNDMEVLPKYFQVGRIMDSPLDHVNERVTRKERKRTMVDELLADAEFQKYNKKKYKEIIDTKRKSEYRTQMRDKRQKMRRTKKKKSN